MIFLANVDVDAIATFAQFIFVCKIFYYQQNMRMPPLSLCKVARLQLNSEINPTALC